MGDHSGLRAIRAADGTITWRRDARSLTIPIGLAMGLVLFLVGLDSGSLPLATQLGETLVLTVAPAVGLGFLLNSLSRPCPSWLVVVAAMAAATGPWGATHAASAFGRGDVGVRRTLDLPANGGHWALQERTPEVAVGLSDLERNLRLQTSSQGAFHGGVYRGDSAKAPLLVFMAGLRSPCVRRHRTWSRSARPLSPNPRWTRSAGSPGGSSARPTASPAVASSRRWRRRW